MILTGQEIKKQMKLGNIVINPFIERNLSTNSYDVTLNDTLLCYDLRGRNYSVEEIREGFFPYLDMKEENPIKEIKIPEEGLILKPGVLYLGSTNECAVSHKYAPMFEGRSSIGRLGISTHVTAGFGDIGWGFQKIEDDQDVESHIIFFDGEFSYKCTFPTWTLEITVVHPIKIYPHVRIGQVYFFDAVGGVSMYSGKYQTQREPQASKLFEDFEKF